ncbi:MAG: hypothetical protein V1763_03000, partial [Parcubacteria group bacterium]
MLKRRSSFYFLDLLLLVAVIAVGTFLWWRSQADVVAINQNNSTQVGNQIKDENCVNRRLIDGKCALTDNLFVYAVMIDNQEDARPASGL